MSFYGYDNDNDIENFIDDSLFSSLQTTNDISNEYFAHVKFDEPEFHFLVLFSYILYIVTKFGKKFFEMHRNGNPK